jgi:protein-L-isoaspartate(D-aspartate) O-methyltransferase
VSVERDHRKPKLIAYPASTPGTDLRGTVIDKTHSRLVITYDENA